jgi:hypothetical protein
MKCFRCGEEMVGKPREHKCNAKKIKLYGSRLK